MIDFIKCIVISLIDLLISLTSKLLPTNSQNIVFITCFKQNINPTIRQLQQAGYNVYIVENNILFNLIKIGTAKYIFFDNYNQFLGGIKNKKNYTFLYWHSSNAIKKFGFQNKDSMNKWAIKRHNKVYNSYDYCFYSSNMQKENFKEAFNFDEKKFISSNFCNNDLIKEVDFDEKSEELKDKYNLTNYIIYIPTFRNENIDQQIDFIKNFNLTNYDIVYSFHPKYDIKLDKGINVKGTDLLYLFKDAKLIISDYSSLIYDAMLLNNNCILYCYDYEHYVEVFGKPAIPKYLKVFYNFEEINDFIKSETSMLDTGENFKPNYHTNFDISFSDSVFDIINTLEQN